MNKLLIFSGKASPRLDYVCRLIFERHLGLAFSISTNIHEFEAFSGAKIAYSALPVSSALHIKPAALLFENGIQPQDIKTVSFNGLTVPFAVDGGHFPFDPFTAIFYFVSRYEEYLPFDKNQYGQFRAADTLACKLGFLNKPVVDIWIRDIQDELAKRNPQLGFKTKNFEATFTYDIDVAYAYKGRSLLTTAGNSLRNLLSFNLKEISKRFRVLNGLIPDPFDTYKAITEQQQLYGHGIIFFFLLGPKNRYNRNLHPYKKEQQQLIKTISRSAETGIHPSYFAGDDFLQLQHEKLLLESTAGKKISKGRQHYLRLVFPTTYQHLIRAGITDDYTLGFAELPGFRAGTCSAFPFYNMAAEEETTLLLHPNTFMEGTFIEDMKLEPAAALPLMQQLADEVKNVNGHFISIWHNHSLSGQNEWKGLKEVHDALTAYATPH